MGRFCLPVFVFICKKFILSREFMEILGELWYSKAPLYSYVKSYINEKELLLTDTADPLLVICNIVRKILYLGLQVLFHTDTNLNHRRCRWILCIPLWNRRIRLYKLSEKEERIDINIYSIIKQTWVSVYLKFVSVKDVIVWFVHFLTT